MRGLVFSSLATIFYLVNNCFGIEPVFAENNLLINFDFEDFTGNTPNSWSKNYSTLVTSSTDISDQIHSGSKAVVLQSSSSSTKYLYQIVPLNAGQNYHLSGWNKIIGGSGNSYLRVSQCSDKDCTHEIKDIDSDHIQSTDWNNLSLNFVASENAISAKLKLSLDPNDSSPVSSVWDNLSLSPVEASSTANSPTNSNKVPKTSVNFTSPSEISVGDEFKLSISGNNLPANSYYIKARIGPDSSHLTSGQTYNNSWLGDNDSWTKFPTFTVGSDGTWQGNLSVKLSSQRPAGNYKILVRIKKQTGDSYLDSSLQDVSFKPSSIASSSNNHAQPSSSDKSSISAPPNNTQDSGEDQFTDDNSEISQVLGVSSQSAQATNSTSTKSGTIKSTSKPLFQGEKLKNNLLDLKDPLIMSGLFLFGLGGVIFLRTKQ